MLTPYQTTDGETPFETWLRLTDEKKQFVEVLERELPNMAISQPGESPKLVLDVGCSNGSTSEKIMEAFDRAGIDFVYYGIDPVPQQVEAFSRSCQRGNVVPICSKFEDYKTSMQFDTSFAIHSLQYTKNMYESILRLMEMSNEIVIVHHGGGHLSEFEETFKDHINVGPRPEIRYGDIMAIAKVADRGNNFDMRLIPYSGTTSFTDWGNRGSKDAQNLISFFFGKPYSEIPREIKYAAHEYLAHECERGMVEELGAIFLKRRVAGRRKTDQPTG